ncbi:MAG: hypothetical protein HN644_00825 [Rhodospirillales bacterium]|jgi:hypothetical protein|nr:hypothetical protein [Rhodospirillales bacterium]MBT4040096.1 hypothetical protein [Rhodospirillales bacterium]MBT4627852.1 hypothetical protein [Rhodospirillales bacterium]MBT5351392.1 hypothetical protein [Rhodospirillales bacterium]MBT5522225.1 hypothetical protein [Rhodospirillales bacterium]
MANNTAHKNDAWAWFEEHDARTVSPPPVSHELHKAFARLLAYPEAKTVLSHLHAVTRNRVLGPDVSEAVLRYGEGQKALVAYMERMAAKGRGEAHTL